MSINFARLVSVSVSAATGVGATALATITRPLPPPNPVTGATSGAPYSQTVDVVQQDARRLAKGGNASWATAKLAVFCAAEALTFVPRVGDELTYAGAKHRVTVVETFLPAGTAIGYFLGCG